MGQALKPGALLSPSGFSRSRASSACRPALTRPPRGPASPAGWFPAKFVEVLDERSKEVRGRTRYGCPWELLPPPQPWRVLAGGSGCEDGEGGVWPQAWDRGLSDPVPRHQYSIAGDDAVTEGVTDLVRGTLCPALKALFEHGLKKPSLLGGACHPWLFIEEVSQWLDPRPQLFFSLSPSLGPVELAQELMGGSVRLVGLCDFDLVPILVSLTLTLTPRQQAGRWRETLTRCIHAWCCVRRTGNRPSRPAWCPPGRVSWWFCGEGVGTARALHVRAATAASVPPSGWMKMAKS